MGRLQRSRGIGPHLMHRRHAGGLSTQHATFMIAEGYTNTAPGFFASVRTFPKRRPLLTNLLLGGVLYVGADWCAQQLQEDSELDSMRLFSFGAFGVANSALGWVVY